MQEPSKQDPTVEKQERKRRRPGRRLQVGPYKEKTLAWMP
jgi:hypothetical protein